MYKCKVSDNTYVLFCSEIDGRGNCTQTLLLGSGEFTSPEFPNDYQNLIRNRCFVHIKGWPGSEVVITFIVFDVEHENGCSFDHVEVNRLIVVCV